MLLSIAMLPRLLVVWFWRLDVAFPAGGSDIEQIVLRWLHIFAGIIWVGFLFFFILAVRPALKALDPALRPKVFPEIASRGLWWLRWSAGVSWLMGFRLFMILAKSDAESAGSPHAWVAWIGIWLGCWLAAFAIEMVLIKNIGGSLGNPIVLTILALFIMTATSLLVLSLLARPGVSNRTLSIAVGGGLGTILFFNIWGIVWRCQKRMILWTRAFAANGTPMPAEAAKLQQMAAVTMLINFWLSFPTVFFMAASSHFPFLSGK